jgi:hypothetical protein
MSIMKVSTVAPKAVSMLFSVAYLRSGVTDSLNRCHALLQAD